MMYRVSSSGISREQSVDQGLATGEELIFVACDLLGHVDILDKLAVVGVDSDLLGIVDVVDNEVAIGTCDDADIVAHTGGTRLEVAEHAVA